MVADKFLEKAKELEAYEASILNQIEHLKNKLNESAKLKDDNCLDFLEALGLKSGDLVRYVHHEWFGPRNAYGVDFEQIVEIERFFISGKEGITPIIKKPKRKRTRSLYYTSFSLFKISGELICENVLEHERPLSITLVTD